MTKAAPGRPQIGPTFVIRFPPDLLARVDQAAADTSTSRAGWLRRAAEEQLTFPRHDLAALAAWMVEEGLASDVGYALSRPDKYRAELYCARHGIDLAAMDDLVGQLEAIEQVSRSADHAHEWTLEQTSPVDFTLRCAHGTVVRDTQAERAGQPVVRCADGCQPPTPDRSLRTAGASR